MNREKFLSKSFPEPNTGCWLWVGKTTADGYGQLHPGDNEFGLSSAHRYSYTIHHGHISANLQVLHKCDQPCCINPDHLFLGTQQENIADMDRKGRRKVGMGVRHSRAKIDDDIALSIKAMYRTGLYKQTDLANRFNISRSVVSKIVNGNGWKHVNGINLVSRLDKCRGALFPELNKVVIKEAVSCGHNQYTIAKYFKISQAYVSKISTQK